MTLDHVEESFGQDHGSFPITGDCLVTVARPRLHAVPASVEEALAASNGRLRRYVESLIDKHQARGRAWSLFDREDLRQEARIAVWKALEAFHAWGTAEFSTYAHRAVRNRLTDYRRQHQAEHEAVEIVNPLLLDGGKTANGALTRAVCRMADERRRYDDLLMATRLEVAARPDDQALRGLLLKAVLDADVVESASARKRRGHARRALRRALPHTYT